MGCFFSKPKTVPSVPTPERTQPSQPTSIPDGTTSILPPKPGTAMISCARGRAQSQSAALSQSRHDDGRDYCNCQETRPRQYPSRRSVPMQRTGLLSIDITALQRAPPLSFGRRIWSAPPTIHCHDIGHQRIITQSMSGLPSATSQTPAGRQGGGRFLSALQCLLPNDFRFRILVVGKRDCGKSSLIRTIFKADMSRSPINVSGRTAEFRPRDNSHLIVHECSASGTGEMQVIRDFITTRNHKSRPVSERLHAIWICIPMSDVIHGHVDEGVKMLLDVGVPLVIVFTRSDLIVPNIPSSRNDYEERSRSLFGNVPAEIVSTRPTFRYLIDKLVQTTDRVILAYAGNTAASPEVQRTQPRMSPVPLAWSVSQRTSREINILAAIEVGRSKYWRGLWSSDDFRGQTLANCIEVIHADIVSVWNLFDKDKYLSSKECMGEISNLVQDLSGSFKSTPSSPMSHLASVTGAPWLANYHENSKEKICLVVGYIIDLTLILCRVFGSPGIVSPVVVQSAINDFASSSLKTIIHSDISSFIKTVPQFQYHDNDVIIAKIKDLTLRHCDPPSG